MHDELTANVVAVLNEHRIECTGPGEVTCRGCRERGWMGWYDFHRHLAERIVTALHPEPTP